MKKGFSLGLCLTSPFLAWERFSLVSHFFVMWLLLHCHLQCRYFLDTSKKTTHLQRPCFWCFTTKQYIFIYQTGLVERQVQIIHLTVLINDSISETCPSPQSYCTPAGPGLVDCLCSPGYHGYKCLRQVGWFCVCMCAAFPITHNWGYITHRLKIWRTDFKPVRHVDAHFQSNQGNRQRV